MWFQSYTWSQRQIVRNVVIDEKVLRQLMREMGRVRREMAGKDFVRYRESFGGHTAFLQLKVLVPVCLDCWGLELGIPPRVPTVSPDDWELDLLLLGFHPEVIEELKTDISAGVGPVQGPWCFVCGRWLPWWEDEDGCYTKEVDFADYFGFEEKESPVVSKAMRKRIVQMYGRKCFACGRTLTADEITIDHIVARSRGGAGDEVNLQVLCKECNNAKGDTLVEEKEAILHFPMRPVPSDAYEGVTW